MGVWVYATGQPRFRRLSSAEILSVTQDGIEYLLDVPALTSNYRCVYGAGCKGTLPPRGEGPRSIRPVSREAGGCCRTGPYLSFHRPGYPRDVNPNSGKVVFQKYVDLLMDRPDLCENADKLQNGWFSFKNDKVKVQTVGGNCIFLNTGKEKKEAPLGCSLFHLAIELGLAPGDTRPFICSVMPLILRGLEEDESGFTKVLVTLVPRWGGWFSSEWFCTDDPIAYTGSAPVYQSMKREMQRMLGKKVYEKIARTLDRCMETSPSLKENWGTPQMVSVSIRESRS